MKKSSLILILFLSFLSSGMFAQKDKQAQLERQRQTILNEIKQIEVVLFKTRGDKKSVLTEVEDINQRITARENLIKVTNQQANYLSRTINNNLAQMEQLREELIELKDDYAAMIRKSYKSKSQQSRVMFLLSSESFLQAYKRVQYMKQYAEFRREQGVSIKEKSNKIQAINADLIDQRKQKDKLIAQNKIEKEKLVKEKKNQEALIATLKKDEGKFAAEIRKKQRAAQKIDNQIDTLIREAIARANAANAAKNTSTATGNTNVETNRAGFAMTPEARLVASNFTNNKGKLPWPVEQGVVVGKYGSHRHPTLPNITRNNSGVEIATSENETARAIFDGEVIEIQFIKGANNAVMIRHGNYITTYSNIINLKVKKGDKVKTKQAIGNVGINAMAGKSILKFYINKDNTKMNPADWIYRM